MSAVTRSARRVAPRFRAQLSRVLSTPLARDVLMMVLIFACLRTLAIIGVGIARARDTPSYFDLQPFGGSQRLWTIPLLWKLLPADSQRVGGQLLLGIVAWSALAAAVARSVSEPRLARLGAAAVLLVGLSPPVTQWDTVLLSESIALSLTVLLIAALLELRRGLTSGTLAVVLALATLWSFTRQVNVMLLILLLPLALWFLFRKGERRIAVIGSIVLLVVALWGAVAVARTPSSLWRFNAFTILTARVLPDRDEAGFFLERGLPQSAALRRVVSRKAPISGRSRAFKDPRMQRWLDHEWRSAYLAFLADSPVRVVRPFGHTLDLLDGDVTYARPRSVIPAPVEQLVFARATGDIAFFGVLAIVLWPMSLRYGRPTGRDLLAWSLLGMAFALILLTWHLAAVDLHRLNMPGAITARVGIVLLILFSLERMIGSRRWLVRDQ